MSRIGRLLARFRDPTIRRILVDAKVTTAASLVSAAIGIVRGAVMARYLGVSDFGRLALITSATMLVRQLISVRGWEWTQMQMAKAFTAKDQRLAGAAMKGGYALGIAVNGVAALLIVALASWVCDAFLDEPGLTYLLRLNALLLLGIWADDASTAALRVIGRFRWLAAYTIIAPVARLVALAPVLLLDLGLQGVVAATVLVQIVLSIWLFVSTRVFLEEAFGGPLAGRLADLRGGWRTHGKTLAVLSVTDTLKTVASDADNLIIGAFHSAATVGPYRAAQTVITGLHQLAQPLYMVYYPEMAKAAAVGNRSGLRRLAGQISLLGLLTGGAGAALVAVGAPFVIGVIYGREFAAAVPALQIMAGSLLVISLGWANPLFVSLGRPGLSLVMQLAGVIAKLICLFLLVPGLPNVGAAIAFVSFHVALGITAIVLARVVLGFSPGED